MKVRASSDSINTRLIDKAFCLVNKYQQIKKKKGRWKALWYFREDS